MKALLERVKVGGLVVLTACCLAFSAAADDGQASDDGAQAETSTGSCSSNCTDKYEMCVAAGGSIGDCVANYNSCTAACSDDADL